MSEPAHPPYQREIGHRKNCRVERAVIVCCERDGCHSRGEEGELRYAETVFGAEHDANGPVASPRVLLYLVDLRERVHAERGEGGRRRA